MNKSLFHLNNTHLTSFEMSELVPFMYRETIPSDEFRGSSNAFIRAMPLVRPVMHKLDLYTRFYYIPYRLLSKDLRKMVTKPLEEVKFMSLYDYLNHRRKLGDLSTILSRDSKNLLTYFGISSSSGSISPDAAKKISMLPFMAYYLVYNYYYLDPILNKDVYQDEFDVDTFKDIDLLSVRRVNRYNDYFTSAKPTTQYGDEVSLDLDNNGSIKVSEMRLSERLQVWYERLLHNFEHRYNETLRGFYGVSPRDETLQRPLFLGGDKELLNIMDVDTTAQFNDEPIASPAGKSLTVGNGNKWDCFCTEHGLILGLAHILPRQSYISGVPKEFTRLTSADLHNPLFNNIGFQTLDESELDANRVGVFGYKERYAEFKECKDVIASDMIFDSNWHLGLDIRKANLNAGFVRAFPQNGAFATQDNGETIQLEPSYGGIDLHFWFWKKNGGVISDPSYIIAMMPTPHYARDPFNFISFLDEVLQPHVNKHSVGYSYVGHNASITGVRRGIYRNDSILDNYDDENLKVVQLDSDFVILDGHRFLLPDFLYRNMVFKTPIFIGFGNSSLDNFDDFPVSFSLDGSTYDISKFINYPDAWKNKLQINWSKKGTYAEIPIVKTDSAAYLDFYPLINKSSAFNHFIGLFYNNTSAIRPLPKRVNTMYY